jgi:hypothetical protein
MRAAPLFAPFAVLLVACPAPQEQETALASAAPSPANVAAEVAAGVVQKKAPERASEVILAGQRVEAPPGFGLTLVQNPPLEKLSAVSANARCDFGVLLNHDTPEERARLVEAMKKQYPGDQKPYARSVGGLSMDGVEVRSNGQDIRVFSAAVGRDLLAVSYAGPFAETDKCDPVLARLLDVLAKAK